MTEHSASPSYSNELGEAICARIAKGETLAEICREPGMPSDRTVRRWVNPKSPFHIEAFAVDYAIAREMGEDAISEHCLRIADDSRHDWIEREGKDGRVEKVFNAEHSQRSKLRIDTRMKLLAKWNPKKWGDKIEATHQAGPSLLETIFESYRVEALPVAPQIAQETAQRTFDPRTGLLLSGPAAVAGGIVGGFAASVAETSMLARSAADATSAD